MSHNTASIEHEIKKLARVYILNRTAAAVENARILVGAPTEALFDFVRDFRRNELVESTGGWIEFTWTEYK